MAEDAAISYRRLGYAALNVSDLDRSIQFYTDVVGLYPIGERAGSFYFGIGDDRPVVTLSRGVPGLKRIGWEVETDADLALARARIGAATPAQPVPPSEDMEMLGVADAFRVRQPHSGATFEFFVRRQPEMQRPGKSWPGLVRLGHVVVGAPDFEGFEAWMRDVCGFAISDRVAGRTSLMRCPPNPLHHSFGVGYSPEPKFHHLNFMVASIDDVGRGLNRLRSHDVPIVFGPGRHPTSNSVFLYYLDPDGLTLEFSFGMELFPPGLSRQFRDLPNWPETADTWGGRPVKGYAAIGALEELEA